MIAKDTTTISHDEHEGHGLCVTSVKASCVAKTLFVAFVPKG